LEILEMRTADRTATIGVLIACFVAFGYAAWHRPFWYDEVLTAYIAGQPTVSDMWGAMRAGFDLTPPLFHLITRASSALWFRPELALRIPGLIGFLVMAACLFAFVRRRCGFAASLAAMLLPMGTLAGRYAVEARPYGLVLGACGVALLCWQSAVEERARRGSLAGLALSVAVAVSLHYYALVILFPIAAGEAVRLARSRRPDWAVWAAVTIGTAALPVNLWLLGLSKARLQNAWAPTPEWRDLAKFYWQAVGPVALLALIGGTVLIFRGKRPWFPAHEVAAAVSLAAGGLFVYAAGAGITGLFIPRYALPAVIGIAVLVAFVSDARERVARVVAAALGAVFAVNVAGALMIKVPAGAPPLLAGRANVVAGSPLRFLQMTYYGAKDVRYLADPTEALRSGTDAMERELLALRPWAPVHVEEYAAFARKREPFLLYWRPWPPTWLPAKLREDGAILRLLGEAPNEEGVFERLYSVEWR
jgi:hypothetical protein